MAGEPCPYTKGPRDIRRKWPDGSDLRCDHRCQTMAGQALRSRAQGGLKAAAEAALSKGRDLFPFSVTAVEEGMAYEGRKPSPREGVGDEDKSAAGAAITWEKRMVSGKIMTRRPWSVKLLQRCQA